MKDFRKALFVGIASAVVFTASCVFYSMEARDMETQRARLSSITSQDSMRHEYMKKIESVRKATGRLVMMARDRSTDVDYEVTLVDHDLRRLMRQVASTYTGELFFLERAVVESTSSGITVSMKGFKLSGGAP